MKKLITVLLLCLAFMLGFSTGTYADAHEELIDLYPYGSQACLDAADACRDTKVGNSHWQFIYYGHRYHVVRGSARYVTEFEDTNADGFISALEMTSTPWNAFASLKINDTDEDVILITANARTDLTSVVHRIYAHFNEHGELVMFEDHINLYYIFNDGTVEAPDWRLATEAEKQAYIDAEAENKPITTRNAYIRMKLDDTDADGYVLEPMAYLTWRNADVLADAPRSEWSTILDYDPEQVHIPAGWTIISFGTLDRGTSNPLTTAYIKTLPMAMLDESVEPLELNYNHQPAMFSGLTAMDDDLVTPGINVVVEYNGEFSLPNNIFSTWINMFDGNGIIINNNEYLDYQVTISQNDEELETIVFTYEDVKLYGFDFENTEEHGFSYQVPAESVEFTNSVDQAKFAMTLYRVSANTTTSVAGVTRALVVSPRLGGENDGKAYIELDFGDENIHKMTFDTYFWNSSAQQYFTKYELHVWNETTNQWNVVSNLLSRINNTSTIQEIELHGLRGSKFRFYAEGGQDGGNTARILLDNLEVYRSYTPSAEISVIDSSVFGSGYKATYSTLTPKGAETVAEIDIVIGVMPPRFVGVQNRYINEGVMVELLQGITANDGYANDKTDDIVVTYPVGFNPYNPLPGEYDIELEFLHNVFFAGVPSQVTVKSEVVPFNDTLYYNKPVAVNADAGVFKVWSDADIFRTVGSAWGSVMTVVAADGTLKERYDRYNWNYTTSEGTIVGDANTFAAWQAALVLLPGEYVVAAHGSIHAARLRAANLSFGDPVVVQIGIPDFSYDIITQTTYVLTVDDTIAPVLLVVNDNFRVRIGDFTNRDQLILSNVVAFDNYDSRSDIAIYVSNAGGLSLNNAGTYTVEVTAEDRAGNQSIVSFTILMVQPDVTPASVQALIDANTLTAAQIQALLDSSMLTEAEIAAIIANSTMTQQQIQAMIDAAVNNLRDELTPDEVSRGCLGGANTKVVNYSGAILPLLSLVVIFSIAVFKKFH